MDKTTVEKMFATKIDKTNELYNEYVLGRITGFQFVLCDEPNGYDGVHKPACSVDHYDDYVILRTRCTEDQYRNFATLCKHHYCNLCQTYFK